jgi:DNA repair protein RadB
MNFSPEINKLNQLISTTDEKTGIISIWGDVGVGKTTLCFGATLQTLSHDKKVIYINTKSFFKSERFIQMKNYYTGINNSNFLIYNPSTFSQQIKIIMNLEFLILKEIKILKKSNIGLIVIDTASTLKTLETRTNDLDNKMQLMLNLSFATLDYIIREYKIPVIITNRLIRQYNETTDESVEKPSHANSINYWAKTSIKIERTNKAGYRLLIIEKHPRNKLKRLNLNLSESGFNEPTNI